MEIKDNLENQFPTISLPLKLLFNGYVIIWWLQVGKRIPFLGTLRIEFLTGAALAFIALIRYPSKASGNHPSLVPHAILLYLFVLVASLPLAIDFNLAWNTFVDKNIKYALMTFFISQFVLSPRHLRYFFVSTLFALLKVGQEAFWGKVTGSMVWENQGIQRLHGSPGTMFSHPNSLSGKFVSFLPFIWYLYPVLKSRTIKLLIGFQLIFSINIIVFTGSRTGYVTFLVMCGIIFLKSRNKLRIFFLFCMAGLVIVVSLPNDYKERFLSSFTGEEAEGQSSNARKTLFFDSLTVFSNHPLGVGLFCFPVAQERAGRREQETHNLYTQLLAETGIQGFLCFMGLLYIINKEIKRAKVGFERCRDTLFDINCATDENMDRLVAKEIVNITFLIAVADAIILFLYIRLILGVFGHDLFEIYWWVMAGISISLIKMLSVSEERVMELDRIVE